MDQNNNFENEIVEEAIEEVQEVAEETVDTVVEPEELEYVEEIVEEAKPGSKVGAIIAVVVSLIIVAVAIVTSMMDFNKYNKLGYVDVSGRTIQDIADAQGITLEEFLDMNGLPADMPGSTTEANAYYSMPTGIVAELSGLDFATLKTVLKLPEEVTEETPWGEAEGMIPLVDYVGDEQMLEEFKAEYGLGDEVTTETLWGEVRNAVHTKEKEKRLAEAEAAKTDELVDDQGTEEAVTDTEEVVVETEEVAEETEEVAEETEKTE